MNHETILIWLLVYVIGISGTVGAICNFDAIPCEQTGNTTQWTLQLVAVIVSLLAGRKDG